MAEKEVKIKVITEADASQLDDLRDVLDSLQNFNVSVNTSIENTNVENLEDTVNDLNGAVVDLNITTNDDELTEAYALVTDWDGTVTRLNLDVDNTSFEDLMSQVDSLENAGIFVDIDSSPLVEASQNADEFSNNTSNADNEIQNLNNDLGLLNASALLDISDKIGSLGSEAEGMAQDMNTAAITVGQLATQTGIAEPQMISLINNISNATFPNDEAMLYVKSLSQAGVASGNLGKSATDIDKINDAFGLGAKTSNSMAMELGVLGVDLNNISDSFNALAYANANTRGGMENFYTFLRKYDAQFKELGFNVDQSALIISAATQKFGGGRPALSGLSTALKEANGDTRALEQALGMQAGSLDNASQITSQYEGQLQSLADEEAEHKTWLDQIGAAWEDMSLAMSPVLEPMGGFLGLIGQAGSWAVGVNGLITLGQQINKLKKIQSVTSKLSNFKNNLNGIGSSAKSALLYVGNLGKTIGTTVLTNVKNAATSFATLGKEVLISGFNALKSAGLWIIHKAQMAASTIATWASTAAQTALNFVMNMNPIMLVVMAITALIAVLGYLYFNNEQVRAAVDSLGQSFMQFGQWIYNGAIYWLQQLQTTLMNLWNYIITLGGLLPSNVQMTGNQILDTIIRVLAFIATLPLQIGMIFINIIAKALGFGNNFSQRMLTAAWNAVTNFGNAIAQIPSRLATELGNALNKVNEWAATLPQKFWDAGVNAVKNFLNALGIHSPGTMQRMLVWEVSEMGRRVPEEGERLLSNVSRLGSDVVDSFGEPSLGLRYDDTLNSQIETGNAGNTGNTGNTYNFNLYGDMDNEDRMNRFVDEVIRRLNFENETAGRTV